MFCVFAKVLWSENLNKEFWLSTRCCETAAVVGYNKKKVRIKNSVCVCVCFFVMCGCLCVFIL